MLRHVMLRSSASAANSESAADSSSTKVSRVSVCLWNDNSLSLTDVSGKKRNEKAIHRNFLKASSLRLALNSATAAAFASFAFSIFVSAYHLCTGSALTQPFSHSAHSTSIQSEEGSPARQFLAESNFTLMVDFTD